MEINKLEQLRKSLFDSKMERILFQIKNFRFLFVIDFFLSLEYINRNSKKKRGMLLPFLKSKIDEVMSKPTDSRDRKTGTRKYPLYLLYLNCLKTSIRLQNQNQFETRQTKKKKNKRGQRPLNKRKA